MSMIRGAFGDRAEPDTCNQILLLVTKIAHAKTITGLIARDKTQCLANQRRGIKKFPPGFALQINFRHNNLL